MSAFLLPSYLMPAADLGALFGSIATQCKPQVQWRQMVGMVTVMEEVDRAVSSLSTTTTARFTVITPLPKVVVLVDMVLQKPVVLELFF